MGSSLKEPQDPHPGGSSGQGQGRTGHLVSPEKPHRSLALRQASLRPGLPGSEAPARFAVRGGDKLGVLTSMRHQVGEQQGRQGGVPPWRTTCQGRDRGREVAGKHVPLPTSCSLGDAAENPQPQGLRDTTCRTGLCSARLDTSQEETPAAPKYEIGTEGYGPVHSQAEDNSKTRPWQAKYSPAQEFPCLSSDFRNTRPWGTPAPRKTNTHPVFSKGTEREVSKSS